MGLFSRKDEPQFVQAAPAPSPVAELPFLLRPNEALEETTLNLQYRGPSVIVTTSGGGAAGDHLFGGVATSKATKRENSAWDAQSADLYLTNQRMVFIKRGGKGGIVGDIPLAAIQSLTAGKFLAGQNIQFSVPGAQGGIDNLSMVFVAKFHGEDRLREAERDQLLNAIRALREKVISAPPTVAASSGDDPMQRLKMRFVNGEITAQQYEEMKRLLS